MFFFFMFLINSRENDENMNNKKMILNSHSETDTEKKGKKVIDLGLGLLSLSLSSIINSDLIRPSTRTHTSPACIYGPLRRNLHHDGTHLIISISNQAVSIKPIKSHLFGFDLKDFASGAFDVISIH